MRLTLYIVVCLGTGWLGSLLTRPALMTWYEGLSKPNWTPPNWLFAPVWTILYVGMGVAAGLVWQRSNLTALPGWWGISRSAEAFVDQLITWRELGFNCSSQRRDYDQFSWLPEWAGKTLREHARAERAYVYTLEEFEQAATHDLHTYLRMLWGKKILEWSPSPAKALETMGELNNK